MKLYTEDLFILVVEDILLALPGVCCSVSEKLCVTGQQVCRFDIATHTLTLPSSSFTR